MYKQFWMIMFFYAMLSCFIMPFLGYYIRGVQGLGQDVPVSKKAQKKWTTANAMFKRGKPNA